MPKQKDHETLTRETHVMIDRLCKRFDHLEPLLLTLPKMCETLRESLAEFRRDVRSRMNEVRETLVAVLTKKPPR